MTSYYLLLAISLMSLYPLVGATTAESYDDCTCTRGQPASASRTSSSTRKPFTVSPTCAPKIVDVAASSYFDADCNLCNITIEDTAAFVPPEICYQELPPATLTIFRDRNGHSTSQTIRKPSISTPSGYQIITLTNASFASPTIDYIAIGSRGQMPCYTITARMVATAQQTGSSLNSSCAKPTTSTLGWTKWRNARRGYMDQCLRQRQDQSQLTGAPSTADTPEISEDDGVQKVYGAPMVFPADGNDGSGTCSTATASPISSPSSTKIVAQSTAIEYVDASDGPTTTTSLSSGTASTTSTAISSTTRSTSTSMFSSTSSSPTTSTSPSISSSPTSSSSTPSSSSATSTPSDSSSSTSSSSLSSSSSMTSLSSSSSSTTIGTLSISSSSTPSSTSNSPNPSSLSSSSDPSPSTSTSTTVSSSDTPSSSSSASSSLDSTNSASSATPSSLSSSSSFSSSSSSGTSSSVTETTSVSISSTSTSSSTSSETPSSSTASFTASASSPSPTSLSTSTETSSPSTASPSTSSTSFTSTDTPGPSTTSSILSTTSFTSGLSTSTSVPVSSSSASTFSSGSSTTTSPTSQETTSITTSTSATLTSTTITSRSIGSLEDDPVGMNGTGILDGEEEDYPDDNGADDGYPNNSDHQTSTVSLLRSDPTSAPVADSGSSTTPTTHTSFVPTEASNISNSADPLPIGSLSGADRTSHEPAGTSVNPVVASHSATTTTTSSHESSHNGVTDSTSTISGSIARFTGGASIADSCVIGLGVLLVIWVPLAWL